MFWRETRRSPCERSILLHALLEVVRVLVETAHGLTLQRIQYQVSAATARGSAGGAHPHELAGQLLPQSGEMGVK